MSIYNSSLAETYRPSFFELIACERLVPALKPAFVHLIKTINQTINQSINQSINLTRYSDEIFLAFHIALESHFFNQYDSSFSEHFYALKRFSINQSIDRSTKQSINQSWFVNDWYQQNVGRFYGHDSKIAEIDQSNNQSNNQSKNQPLLAPLSSTARSRSLLIDCLLPYIKEKLDRRFVELRDGLTEDGFQSIESINQSIGQSDNQLNNQSINQSIKASLKRWFILLYPYLSAINQSVHLFYQLRYLFDQSIYWSPAHLLNQIVTRRMSPADFQSINQSSDQANNQSANLVDAWMQTRSFGLIDGLVIRFVVRLIGRMKSLFVSFSASAKYLILFSLFGLKVLEWINQTNQSNNRSNNQNNSSVNQSITHSSPTVKLDQQPIPPPPPIPAPANPSLIESINESTCPLCHRERTNSAASISGYVFCYPCIFAYVQDEGKCPVTHRKCDVQSIRKIYET